MCHIKDAGLKSVLCLSLLFLSVVLTGCGFDRILGPLPDLVEGLTLAELEEIQHDDRLTDDQKREAIREAISAPDTEDGDRLVEFLLDFDVP